MKSIEEKAKAYDKAIKIAKDSFNDPDFPGLIRADVVFPELEESEDERIRKGLIEHLKELKKQSVEGSHLKRPEHYDAWIAWLKKQCEQKPAMIQWKGDNLKEVIDFTGKSPKFDEWFNTWSDFENYVHSHNDILKLFCEDGSHYEVPVGAWIVRTPDGYNVASQATYKQKAVEWSEGDKAMLVNLVAWIEGKWGTLGGKVGGKEAYISFLKSIQERYTWKPSEKHIKALDNILKHFRMLNAEGETIDNLIELKEQLKKLREE